MHTCPLERVIRNKINSRSGYFVKEYFVLLQIRANQLNSH